PRPRPRPAARARRPRPLARAGAAGPPAARHPRSRAPRRRAAAVRAHPRRPDLALGLPGAPPAALRARPVPRRRRPALRLVRHRLLGPAHAPRRPVGDHAHRAATAGSMIDRRRLMDQGRAAFNRGEFYEAHEFWEEVWNEIDDPERLWVQGMIQVA